MTTSETDKLNAIIARLEDELELSKDERYRELEADNAVTLKSLRMANEYAAGLERKLQALTGEEPRFASLVEAQRDGTVDEWRKGGSLPPDTIESGYTDQGMAVERIRFGVPLGDPRRPDKYTEPLPTFYSTSKPASEWVDPFPKSSEGREAFAIIPNPKLTRPLYGESIRMGNELLRAYEGTLEKLAVRLEGRVASRATVEGKPDETFLLDADGRKLARVWLDTSVPLQIAVRGEVYDEPEGWER